MWQKVASGIIRYRLFILIGMGLFTAFMGYKARSVELEYEFGTLLPQNDSTNLEYLSFRESYGQDGLIIVVSTETEDFYEVEKFKKWRELGKRIKALELENMNDPDGPKVRPIDSVFSEAHLYNLTKNKAEKKFELAPVITNEDISQADVDSIKGLIDNLPFYHNVIRKESSNIHLMMIFVNEGVFNSKNRGNLVGEIQAICADYQDDFGDLRYSGLPFVRSITMNKVKSELGLFVILAILVTATILYIFYRSMKVVITSLIVVGIGVVCSLGTMGLLGYQISILMGLMPPLMIVIGIPNCVYLITKYQQEYLSHGNKAKALTRVIRKVGNATFLTNATTALGFGTFLLTNSSMMRNFGMVASINILGLFFISILIVPIVYSYFSPPKRKHVKHFDKKWLDGAIDILMSLTNNYRNWVYVVTVVIAVGGVYGISLMKTSGNIVDDLPKGDPVVQDLKYFEKEFNGVMPFEVLIRANDTIYKGARNYRNIILIDSVQSVLATEDKLSKSLSVVNGLKYLSQAYSNGNKKKYVVPSLSKLSSMKDSPYINNTLDDIRKMDSTSSKGFLTGFLNENHLETRITVQIKDVGIDSMEALLGRVKGKISAVLNAEQVQLDSAISVNTNEAWEEYFLANPWTASDLQNIIIQKHPETESQFEEFEVELYDFKDSSFFQTELAEIVEHGKLGYTVTGSGVIYTKGTTYLVGNLFTSLIAAIIIIALLMSVLFRSWRMVLVSLIPNILPLVFTSGLMGYLGIPIKPSTILVFSIAFGISVDDTIHFLAKYRQELKLQSWNIKGSVINAIKETGVSMIYTSIILFFGFSIFIFSNFGGTQALGILVSVTLFIAMMANLVLLPSLLLTLEKFVTTKAFRDPLLEIVDEEEDIELEQLEIENS